MLSALFAEEDAIGCGRMVDNRSFASIGKKPWRSPPSAPRHAARICGIANQGATCYLNSLLQTLFFTTEFRERLFRLDEDQLGSLQKINAQTRIIPLQLQRLFGKLLLLDVESASTTDLTDSFGWTNNEELQQHDVQELNRILFQAIESSLVGTAGNSLVKELYNGRLVNQISCLRCGRVSEREEDFLDMNVTVSGNGSLDKAFENMFVEVEMMDGNNRYQCATCHALTDATKGMKIRSLPPILTVSLLRFSYDLINFQRFKETGNFAFPTELDLAPYCDSSPSCSTDTNYELFSVIVHKGSCYGGHYHCFIRDKDAIGNWMPPEDEKISLPTVSAGKVDYLAFDDPEDLVSALLVQTPSNSMTLDNLCAEISRVTGVSWNKRFKRQFGTITKFLRSNQNLFSFNETTKAVTLLHIDQQRFANGHLGWDNPLEVTVGRSSEVSGLTTGSGPGVEGKFVGEVSTSPRHSSSASQIEAAPSPSPAGHDPSFVIDAEIAATAAATTAAASRWFNVDDSRVKSVREDDLKNQFSGKESAYMLFYRRKATYPSEAVLYDLPPWLLDEVTEENRRLAQQRTDYENDINHLSVELLFSSDFEFRNGAICPSVGNAKPSVTRSHCCGDNSNPSYNGDFESAVPDADGLSTSRPPTISPSVEISNNVPFHIATENTLLASATKNGPVSSSIVTGSETTAPSVIADGDLAPGTGPASNIEAAISDESSPTQTNEASFAETAFVPTTLVLDRRKSIQEMISAIKKAGKDKIGGKVTVNLVRQFPGGLQLLSSLLSPESSSPGSYSSSSSSSSSSSHLLSAPISSLTGLVDGALLFVWNGSDVNGVPLPEDVFVEPVHLEIKTQRLDERGNPYQESLRHTFPKSMLLSELRQQLPYVLNENTSRGREGGGVGGALGSTPFMEILPETASIARVRTKGHESGAMDGGGGGGGGGNGDARHLSFDSFLLDHQHDDKTFLELGLVDYDTIVVDLTGFSNQDFAAPVSPNKNSWAAITDRKTAVKECLYAVPSSPSTSVTTDINLPNGSYAPVSPSPSSLPASADLPSPTLLSKTEETISAGPASGAVQLHSSSTLPSTTINIRAQIKSVGWLAGDILDTPAAIEVTVSTNISVGKLKYVIIDAAKAKADQKPSEPGDGEAVRGGREGPGLIPGNDAKPFDVSSNDSGTTKSSTTTTTTTTTASTNTVETPQLNGKLSRLRIMEENFGLRTPLMERASLSEAGLKEGMTVVLEDGVAPKPGQITISFAATVPVQEAEITLEKDFTINECICQMVSLLSLSESAEGWHLRKTNWEGEAVEAVEDNSLTLDQEGIKDGDHVLLEEGVVPPKGFLRLPVWLLTDANQMEETTTTKPTLATTTTTTKKGNAEVDTACELESSEVSKKNSATSSSSSSSLQLLQGKIFVADLELTQDATLLSLKEDCIRILTEKCVESPSSIWPSMSGKKAGQIRIATIDAKGIQGSVLKGHKATLKILHVTNNVQLLVSVVEKAEDPSPSQVILRTYLRLPESKSYESLGEILWETAGAGATAASLRTAIAKAHDYPSTEVILAKYFPEKYEWMILTDSKSVAKQTSIKKQYGKQSSKKGAAKKNLRQSPFYIQDGDVIGVKTLSSDPMHLDNFMTENDEVGKARLKDGEEEKKRKRQENRQRQNSESQNVIGGSGCGSGASAGGTNKQSERKYRPEAALTIHVPKYE